jgi:hypothetical protein
VLKLKIDKVTVICVTKSLFLAALPCSISIPEYEVRSTAVYDTAVHVDAFAVAVAVVFKEGLVFLNVYNAVQSKRRRC